MAASAEEVLLAVARTPRFFLMALRDLGPKKPVASMRLASCHALTALTVSSPYTPSRTFMPMARWRFSTSEPMSPSPRSRLGGVNLVMTVSPFVSRMIVTPAAVLSDEVEFACPFDRMRKSAARVTTTPRTTLVRRRTKAIGRWEITLREPKRYISAAAVGARLDAVIIEAIPTCCSTNEMRAK